MIHTLCTIRFRNQRTDQGSLDPGSVAPIFLLAVSCIRSVRSRQDTHKALLSGFTTLMNVERVGWTASSWAMPSQGPTDPRVAPTKRSFAGKDTVVSIVDSGTWPESVVPNLRRDPASLRPQRDPMVPRLPPCGATRSDARSISPLGVGSPKHDPYLYASDPKGLKRGLWILCASRRTSPCRQEAGHRGPHVGSFAQRAPLYERLEPTGIVPD